MRTKDYGLTCLLLCKGYDIVKFTSDDAGRIWFDFQDGNAVEKVVDDFYMNRASVLLGDYLAAQKRVKNIINHRRDYGYEYDNRNFSGER